MYVPTLNKIYLLTYLLRKLPRYSYLDTETIIDFFSWLGRGSVDILNEYDYLIFCQNKYTYIYSSTIEALNFLNPAHIL